MEDIFISGVLPTACSETRQLVVSPRPTESCGAESRPDVSEGWLAGLRALIPPTAIVWGPDDKGTCEVLCKASDFKELRKGIKSNRKTSMISIDKRADEMISQNFLRHVIMDQMRRSLVSKGWSQHADDLFVHSRMSPCDDGKLVLSAKLALHLADDVKFSLQVTPDLVKFRHAEVLVHFGRRGSAGAGESMNPSEWFDELSCDERQKLECTCLPSLRKGWLVGFRRVRASDSKVQHRSLLEQHGIAQESDILLADVRMKSPEAGEDFQRILTLPSTCILSGNALISAPLFQRRQKLKLLLNQLSLDANFNLLGAGPLQFENRGKLLKVDLKWSNASTAQGMLRTKDCLPNLVPAQVDDAQLGSRRPKPAPLMVRSKLQEKPKEAPSVSRQPLMVPHFAARRLQDCTKVKVSGSRKLDFVVEKDLGKQTTSDFGDKSKRAEPLNSTSKTLKMEESAAMSGKSQRTASRGCEGQDTTKGPAKRAKRAKTSVDAADQEDVGAMIREKFACGRLKGVTLPKLKQFISKEKLGKVGGKKEELLSKIEDFLGKHP